MVYLVTQQQKLFGWEDYKIISAEESLQVDTQT